MPLCIGRRTFLHQVVAVTTGMIWAGFPSAILSQTASKQLTRETWMDEWMRTRSLKGGLYLGRFLDRTYFLTKSISWKPNPGQPDKLSAVNVPVGFVTDLTSVPRVFWSLLPPDGEYVYAAIIHDYLYWTQTTSKDVADQILKFAMEDLGVDSTVTSTIHAAVSTGGSAAWNNNAELKSKGEKRVLKRFPDDPKVRWQDWKKTPDVFT